MRYRKSALLILLLCLPSIAFALNVTLRVDGQPLRSIDADRVNIITSDDGILIDVRTEPKTAPPKPPPAPPVPPPPDPTDCSRPPGVQVGNTIDMTNSGGQERITITGTSAWPFRTTRNPSYAGQFSTVAASYGIGQRKVWISKCAGGQPLGPRCEASGNGSAVVRWAQSEQRGSCELEPDTAYWLNAQAVQCPSGGCVFFRNVYTNQQP